MEEELTRSAGAETSLQWTPVIAGALAATALSFVLIAFGVAIGLGVSSASPTWRDASAALAILSGLYLILQAVASFGLGGYIAGRARSTAGPTRMDLVESRDGLHGLAAWALAVLLGAALAALIGASGLTRSAASAPRANASSAEPLLSYELDRLLRSPKRAPNVDIAPERAEAGRILMTTSSHSGVSSDDRSFLVQLVASAAGLPPADAEKRVDTAIAESQTAIARSRHSSVILAFSVAAATLLGAVASWWAACAGGRHRDGAPLPEWMEHSNRFGRNKLVMPS